jgi:hypothetical protein
MAKPILLQDDFSGGMKPDLPNNQVPKNAVRNMRDFIPNIGDAPLSLRNGWRRVGATMSTTYAAAVSFAPFTAAAQLVGIADTGAVFQVPHTATGANTSRGTAQIPIQSPVFYRNVLYIPSSDGSTSVKQYGGSSNAAAATGSPPAGMLCAVFKDHLVLARDATTPNRIWFASGGDATSWDTAADGQWLDASFPVTGLAVVRNMLLVFSEQGVERIRGDIIPGVVGSDMVREPLPIPGCSDPASIVVADDVCYYTNAAGIYMTDGLTSVDLTDQCGMKLWWNETTFSYNSNWTLAAGFFQGRYMVSAMAGSELEACIVCEVRKRAMYEFTNVPATMFTSLPLGHTGDYPGGLYMSTRDAPWLARASDMFYWQNAGGDVFSRQKISDGNSTAMSPRLRTGYFGGGTARKRFKKLYVTHELETGFTVAVNAYPDEKLSESVDYSVGTLTETSSVVERQKMGVGRAQRGISIDITQPSVGVGVEFFIYSLEAEVEQSEGSRYGR